MPTIRIDANGNILDSRHTRAQRTTTAENEAVRWRNLGQAERTITFATESPFDEGTSFSVPARKTSAWCTVREDVRLESDYPYSAPLALHAGEAPPERPGVNPLSGPVIIVESGDGGGGLTPPPVTPGRRAKARRMRPGKKTAKAGKARARKSKR